MITQAIKDWFRRAFAWWPWRQAAPVEDPHMSGPLKAVAPKEGLAHSNVDGAAPQASSTPRLSTMEERPRYISQTPLPSNIDPAMPPLSPLPKQVESSQDTPPPVDVLSPTPEQRLEFLRYLVKRGLVNEGHEEM